MALLRNPRWEKFAQAVAAGVSASEAYRSIDGKGKNANVIASRMLANVNIRKRIKELQQESATSKTLDMQERREINAEIARNAQNRPADRIAATLADAKLAGELTDKVQTTTQEHKPIICMLPPIITTPRPTRKRANLPPRK